MRKAYKKIISLSVVLIAGLNFIVPAFAQDPFTAIAIGGLTGASGAGLFGSMAAASGIDIGWSASGSDPMDAMWNVLNPDHVYFSGEKHEADPQSDPEDIYDYIQVNIGDWLTAQRDFITAFCEEYEVADNSQGTVQGTASYHGIPFTELYSGSLIGSSILSSGNFIGQSNELFRLGGAGFTVEFRPLGNHRYDRVWTGPQGVIRTESNKDLNFTRLVGFALLKSGNYVTAAVININDNTMWCSSSTSQEVIDAAVNVNWVSNTVNTHVFDGYESAKVKIPKSISQLQTGWTVPDFLNELDRLWENNLQLNIVIEDGDDPDPPVPPPPIPDTPLGDVPFDDFIDLWGTAVTNNQDTANDKLDFIGSNGEDQLEELENINTALADLNDTANHIDAGVTYILQDTDSIDTNVGSIEGYTENIDTNIDSLVDTADNIDTNITSIESLTGSIDTNVDDIADTAESIDTNIGIGNGLLGGIRSLAQSAVNYLESIAEHVAELVEEIVLGTETLIAGILNQIPSAFGVIFGPIKQASSIWHYVVEWIQSISAPMSWMWSMASGTSYNIILPVYASLAGAVVLAFYKRFGK